VRTCILFRITDGATTATAQIDALAGLMRKCPSVQWVLATVSGSSSECGGACLGGSVDPLQLRP
jgi:hypothetical protein